MKESLRVLGLTGLLLATGAGSASAQRPWNEARSDHFTVVSDGDDKTARTIAWQFEQMRAATVKYWPWADADMDRPFLVLAVRNEEAMKQIAPKFWEPGNSVHPTGIAVTGPDRHYAALRTDILENDRQGTTNPYMQAYWSYSSIVIGTSLSRNLPLWFSRGLASVMSNTIVRDSWIEVGRISPSALGRLVGSSRLRLREFAAVDRRSPWYTQADRLQAFDAQASVFVHYLMFGDDGAHRQALDRFVKMVLDGGTPAASFEPAFGNLDALETGFVRYLQSQIFNFTRLDVDVNIKREAFAARALSPAESAATRAAFHAAMSRPVEARALIEEARKANPSLAAPNEVEGLLLDADGKFDESRQAYGRAQELGSSNFYAKYRWAELTWARPDADPATRARVLQSLQEATSLNTRFSPAYALLGEVRSRLGTPDEGLGLVRRAISLDPDRIQNRLALARILWTASNRDEAQQEARRALAMASTDADRQSAQELIAFFAENARPPAPAPAAAPQPQPPAVAGTPAAPSGNDPRQRCVAGDAAACTAVMPAADSACAAGTAAACSFLAQIYALGRGVSADLVRAATLFQQACDRGSRVDCVNVATMQADGRGMPRDAAKATATLERLCGEGLGEACTGWAVILLQNKTQDDLAHARELLNAACGGGLSRACDLLKSVPQ